MFYKGEKYKAKEIIGENCIPIDINSEGITEDFKQLYGIRQIKYSIAFLNYVQSSMYFVPK